MRLDFLSRRKSKVILDRKHSRIIGRLRRRKIAYKAYQFLLGYIVGNRRYHAHFTFRDRSRLVNAKRIYTRKSFNALHVMYKHFPCGKPHRADCESCTCKQEKSFRNHSYNCRNHSLNAVAYTVMFKKMLLIKKQKSDRNYHNSRNFHDLVKRAYHFRTLSFFCFLRLYGQLRNVRFLPYPFKARSAKSRNYEASRHQRIACAL